MSPRYIRDPIHRDIRLDPIESAVVDTRIFQRLRYIRQNGLLHLVFPGAVHTRFAHSLGTMDIARRVAVSLFEPLRGHSSSASLNGGLDYLAQVFRLAALLHDVGHGAFSHSIEHIRLDDGRSFLGTTRELFERWRQQPLLAKYLECHPEHEHTPVTHEQIGLILVTEVFEGDQVADACRGVGWDPSEVAEDVRALIDGSLPVSAAFKKAAFEVAKAVPDAPAEFESMAEILHGLVSGTLDVDRLDYLVRDSIHCGVPYGCCEVDLLVRSLTIGLVDGKLNLLLDRKAAHALDDMLWSRYQLFLQVLNHKTNVGLNAALGHAIIEARSAGYVQRPQSADEYIAFIDDQIIGQMFDLAQMPDTEVDDKPFTKLFVDRRVPRHVRAQRLGPDDELEDVRDEIRDHLARELGLPAADVLVGVAQSELLKQVQPLPRLLDRRAGSFEPFQSVSTVMRPGGVGSSPYRVLHFYLTTTEKA